MEDLKTVNMEDLKKNEILLSNFRARAEQISLVSQIYQENFSLVISGKDNPRITKKIEKLIDSL